MQTPTSVKIAGQVFTVVERDSKDDGLLGNGNYAYTLDAGNLIVLDAAMAFTKKQQTLIHEVMHVIRMVFDGKKKPDSSDTYEDWEHHFIGIFEGGMLGFLKDNPEVVAWITEEGR